MAGSAQDDYAAHAKDYGSFVRSVRAIVAAFAIILILLAYFLV